MYKNKKILGIILARGETKHIPKKNIKLFADKPLFTWVTNAALDSNYIDTCILSSDDSEILALGSGLDELVCLKRPDNLIDEKTPKEEIIKNIVEEYNYDYVIAILPTQPLVEPYHLDEALALAIDTKSFSVASALKLDNRYLREFDKKLKPVSKDSYLINNAFYINSLNNVKNKSFSLKNPEIPYIIDSKYDGNIDSKIDWEISELKKLYLLLEKNKKASTL